MFLNISLFFGLSPRCQASSGNHNKDNYILRAAEMGGVGRTETRWAGEQRGTVGLSLEGASVSY